MIIIFKLFRILTAVLSTGYKWSESCFCETCISKVARLRKRSMVPAASAENTAGGEEAAGALVLQENVRHTPTNSSNVEKAWTDQTIFTGKWSVHTANGSKVSEDCDGRRAWWWAAFYQLLDCEDSLAVSIFVDILVEFEKYWICLMMKQASVIKSGEAKGAIDRCKKFLNNVETRSRSLFCQKPSFPMIFSSSVNLPAKSSSTPGKTLRYALLFVSHNKVVLCLLLFEPKHPCPSIESISECFKSLSTAPELLWLPAHLSEPTHPALVPISTWWIPPSLPLFPHPLLQLAAVAPSSCLLQILLLCELLPRPNHPSFSWLSLPSSPPVPFSPFSSSHQPWRCWFLPLNLWPDPFRFGFICWLFWTSNGQLAHYKLRTRHHPLLCLSRTLPPGRLNLCFRRTLKFWVMIVGHNFFNFSFLSLKSFEILIWTSFLSLKSFELLSHRLTMYRLWPPLWSKALQQFW